MTSRYSPGTKLSYNNGSECCTVLTEGNAMVTRVWGERWWEQMWLADWLILAEGKEREDFIPISKEVQSEDEYADMPELISFPIYPARPIGTKLKWTMDGEDETYRIAIITQGGVCQVKAVTEGGGDCYFVGNKRYLTKRIYDNEWSWRQSLPDGGSVVVY